MKAGSLRNLIEIEEPVEQLSDYGETVTTWHHKATCDAAITPLSAREFFAAQQVQSDVSHRIVIRFVPAICPRMRVRFGCRIFHVESVLADERELMLTLLCKETT